MTTGNTANANFEAALSAQRQGRTDEAERLYRAAIAAAPGALEPRVHLAKLLLAAGRKSSAMAEFEKALDVDPHLQAVCRDVTQIPSEEARCEAILQNTGHILARYPDYAPSYYHRACALLSLGRIAEARRAAEQALMRDASVPVYYHVLMVSGSAAENANAVAALEQLAGYEDHLDDLDRAVLHFLLAQARHDAGRKDEAFAHWQKANDAKRRSFSYDEAAEMARLRAIAAAFPAERFQDAPENGGAAPSPVFVIGMPRSGTTLVEQILASHPAVFGAGELDVLPKLIGEHLPRFPADCDRAGMARIGAAYAARLKAIAPAAAQVADKWPTNFLHAGLIRLALPGARIIHIRRDPLDTCFSCYTSNFGGAVPFAYELGELGRYYRTYEALMAHWRMVLPEGAMLEVQYESLVGDLPAEARRILDYCGLAWDERCHDFHKTKRAVASASLIQVRKPLYRSAIGRAGAYAAQLAPLRQALGLN